MTSVVPQESVLGSLWFLIYDLPRCEIFADDKFLFSEAIKYILKLK